MTDRLHSFCYWIKFDKDRSPEFIRASTFVEFRDILERLVLERQEMPEWIIRDYTR